MKNPKKIKDILATLSPEELELHKDLIEECLSREKEIEQHSKNLNNNLKKINSVTYKLVEDLNKIANFTVQINNMLGVKDQNPADYSKSDIRYIPEDEFIKT
jgi:transposase